jgi:hypothetical protein
MADYSCFVKDLEGSGGGLIGVVTRDLPGGTGEEHEKRQSG